VPPQPLVWFQSLIRNFNEELTIWIVSANGRPAAGLLTLRFKDDIVFKHGGSDARFHNLGSVPFLYFTALQDAQKRNAKSLDFGRSDLDNPGLLRFKDNWGASRIPLTYYRLSQNSAALAWRPRGMGLAQVVFSSLPKPLLTTAGRLLYRHIG
jgi:lipid II:glycine glycyltransferase (peptidoglycan interpeptide bridge formation enzyme)